MTYSTVMVHLDLDGSNDACIKIAGGLAEKFSANVIGITACNLSAPAYFTAGPHSAKLFEESRAVLNHKMAEMERHFRHALRGQATEIGWRSAIGYPTDFVTEQARAADLLIAGANRGGDIPDPLRQLDLGELLMQAGRPVFVVPPQTEWLDIRSVMVAWKDTREARQAINNALPLLQLARDVQIVEILEEGEGAPIVHERLHDVLGWLARHGIDASAHVPKLRGNAVSQLDEAAANMGATVIVAGAYGHSRVREWVLGGVTRHLITDPRRCALLSH